MLRPIKRQVIYHSRFGALHGNVAQVVLLVDNYGEARDVVDPVVIFVVLERDFFLGAEHGQRHHEDIVRYHDANAFPLGQILEDHGPHEFFGLGVEFLKGFAVGSFVGPVRHEFHGTALHAQRGRVLRKRIRRDFQEPVAGDVVVRDELREARFAAAYRDVVRGFVRAHESRRDVRKFLVAFEALAQVLRHLDAVRGEFGFDGHGVFAFGMADDKYRFFVWREAFVDVGDGREAVAIERDFGGEVRRRGSGRERCRRSCRGIVRGRRRMGCGEVRRMGRRMGHRRGRRGKRNRNGLRRQSRRRPFRRILRR